MYKRSPRTPSRVAWRLCGITFLAALVAGMSGSIIADGAASIRSATVTVNAANTLAVVPDTAIGVNTAVWDPYLTAPDVPSYLQKVHTEILRYPGGSTADTY